MYIKLKIVNIKVVITHWKLYFFYTIHVLSFDAKHFS